MPIRTLRHVEAVESELVPAYLPAQHLRLV
jgi:hypothetical protein